MLRSYLLFLLLFFHASIDAVSQCLTAPLPPACTGSEPAAVNNETIGTSSTKWFNNGTSTFSNLTMNGGTLVVCSDLTVNNFNMTGGTIYIRPGARLVLGSGSGAGLVLNGNSAIYNYGTLEVQRNLSLDAGATAARPNIIINATPASVLRMPFTYFVINNNHSWFVNNGIAEFGGVITDQYASPASMCLSNGSTTRMNILINKVADTYKVDYGNACVYVAQNSFFNNKLTANPNLYVCLSSGHSSYSNCGGCPANNWGAATTITGCSSCAALGVLANVIIELNGSASGNGNALNWTASGVSAAGYFTIERSSDALHYTTIAVVDIPANTTTTTSFHYLDKSPGKGYSYYMIKYINKDKTEGNSKSVRVSSVPQNGITISPMPFIRSFVISLPADIKVEKIIVTDMTGRNIPIRYSLEAFTNKIDVQVMEDIASGIYLLHLKSDKTTIARTIFKQ